VRQQRAFTLIELLAVLLIMALVIGVTLPNLSLRSERVVLDAAQRFAASLAYTRQRAVATGTPHRVVIDLDAAAWWIEVWPEQASVFEAPPPSVPGAAPEVQLDAPQRGNHDYQPLGGPQGRPRFLAEGVRFDAIETLAAGAVASGQVELIFEGDGTADPARLLLINESEDVVEVQLARLADEIRIRRE
jgi:prepilin-type N-terminal cleavage/methylation domain-containing protein